MCKTLIVKFYQNFIYINLSRLKNGQDIAVKQQLIYLPRYLKNDTGDEWKVAGEEVQEALKLAEENVKKAATITLEDEANGREQTSS